jgi:hypothetical protein
MCHTRAFRLSATVIASDSRVSFVFCARNALRHGLSGLTGTPHRVDLLDRVDVAVDRHVQPRRKQMLVKRGTEPRRHLGGEPVRATVGGPE